MRIGHCQYDSQLGDFEGNLAKVVAGLERAQREQVEIVSFPECFLTGDTTIVDRGWEVGRSLWSAREFGQQLLKIARGG